MNQERKETIKKFIDVTTYGVSALLFAILFLAILAKGYTMLMGVESIDVDTPVEMLLMIFILSFGAMMGSNLAFYFIKRYRRLD